MTLKFTVREYEVLVEEIRKYPPIFNYEDSSYKNIIIKENAWKKIAFSVGKNNDDCKKRWRSIKDTYFRNKKKCKLGTGSEASQKPPKWNLFDRLSFLDVVKHKRTPKTTVLEKVHENWDNENQIEEDVATDSFEESSSPSASHTQGINLNPVEYTNEERVTSNSVCTTPVVRTVRKVQPKTRNCLLAQFEKRAQKRMKLLEEIHKKNVAKEQEDDVDLFMRSISMTVKKFPPALINEVKMGILKIVGETQLKLSTKPLNSSTNANSSGATAGFSNTSHYQQNNTSESDSSSSPILYQDL